MPGPFDISNPFDISHPFGGSDRDTLPIIYDSFTDANGTLLSSHVPNIAPLGSSWVAGNGVCQIQSNRASWISNGVTPPAAVYWIESGIADGVVSAIVTLPAGASHVALIGRATDKNNCYLFDISTVALYILKRVAGGVVLIATKAFSAIYGVPYFVEVTLTGNNQSMYVDGVLELTGVDTGFPTATMHGLYSEGGGLWDEFQVVRA